jgi:glucose 1-dehydrogenase
MIDLKGKTALITGGAQGIGLGCALELARAGADIILNDRPGSSVLAAAAAEVRALGVTVHEVEADVFSRTGCEGLMQQALALAGQVDILVSNPAYGKRGAFLTYDPVDFDRVIDATFKAGFHMSQLVAQHMVARGGGGKIIFISSVHARMPFANSAPYGAAKAALNSLGRSLAVELCGHRINVNVIEPGWIDTPNERVTFAADVIEEEGRRLPWGRLGLPEDIGRAAAFLASDMADYISGVILPVDGMFRLKDLRAEDLPPLVNP